MVGQKSLKAHPAHQERASNAFLENEKDQAKVFVFFRSVFGKHDLNYEGILGGKNPGGREIKGASHRADDWHLGPKRAEKCRCLAMEQHIPNSG